MASYSGSWLLINFCVISCQLFSSVSSQVFACGKSSNKRVNLKFLEVGGRQTQTNSPNTSAPLMCLCLCTGGMWLVGGAQGVVVQGGVGWCAEWVAPTVGKLHALNANP